MIEQEYENVRVIWDDIMSAARLAIKDKLMDTHLSEEQWMYIHEQCTEDLYHAGWSALHDALPRGQ